MFFAQVGFHDAELAEFGPKGLELAGIFSHVYAENVGLVRPLIETPKLRGCRSRDFRHFQKVAPSPKDIQRHAHRKTGGLLLSRALVPVRWINPRYIAECVLVLSTKGKAAGDESEYCCKNPSQNKFRHHDIRLQRWREKSPVASPPLIALSPPPPGTIAFDTGYWCWCNQSSVSTLSYDTYCGISRKYVIYDTRRDKIYRPHISCSWQRSEKVSSS